MQSGEVWYEVAGELAQEGLRPVTPDQECLTEIWQTHEEKAEETLKKQVFHYNNYIRLIIIINLCVLLFLKHELIEEQHKRDQDEELEFYEMVGSSMLSCEINQSVVAVVSDSTIASNGRES